MPIHHAVLSLLEAGPSYGYELKAKFEQEVGPQWGSLNIGHLYQVLDRLGRDGFVGSRRHPQPARPDRVVYEITPAGRAELAEWLAQPAKRAGGFRDDLFIKLMAAARSQDESAPPRLLSAQRAYLLGELRDLAELRRQKDNRQIVSLLVTAAELQVRAQLEFVDAAEEELLVRGSTGQEPAPVPRTEPPATDSSDVAAAS
jgi:DNA-binding PadR family transcriptional regulator